MNHIVFFSSGAASTVAAMRVAQKYGTENLYLLFADTGIEDEDNYRFLQDSANHIGGQLVHLKDGRTPWDVFNQGKWLSHRQGEKGCSYQLKVLPCKEWIENNPDISPENTVLYFGINFEEIHRIDAIAANWSPYKVETPLCWDEFGWADKAKIFSALKQANLTPPRLYEMGFSHANCGGFCIKAGLGHYRNLLKQMPERYAHHEQQEKQLLAIMGRDDIGILRRQSKGITLEEWRKEIEAEPIQLDLFNEALGGCNCFTEVI